MKRGFIGMFATAVGLVSAGSAGAFSGCTSYALSGPGAQMTEEGSDPVIYADQVYVGYTQNSNVVVQRWSKFGKLPHSAVTIYQGAGKTRNLRLKVDHKHVYALWTASIHGASHLMFERSLDYGKTWMPPLDLGVMHAAAVPQLSADGRNVHIIYALEDSSIAIRNSGDTGHSFSDPTILDSVPGREVVVASRGEDVYAAWETQHPEHVKVGASHNGGLTFTVQDEGSNGHEPIFWLDQLTGRLSLVWRDHTPEQGVYLQSQDGILWTDPIVIDQPARQFMVTDSGGDIPGAVIYVSYLQKKTIDGKFDFQIALSESTDGGKTFSAPENLGGPSGISHVKADDQRPIPWSDGRNFTLTGVKSDGVYVWSGRRGKIKDSPIYLGPGTLASPAGSAVGWLAPDGVVMYAYCK